jgi:hypothetical protein
MRKYLLPALLFSSLFACEDPDVSEYEPRTGIISGSILYRDGTARGNVIVLLFREDSPPPPRGTSRPVNFIVVPEEQMFKNVDDSVITDFATTFTMPAVPAGRYQIRAFLDADGDFNPVQDLLAQPTAGDIGGGHVDPDTQTFLTVVVENDRDSANVAVYLGSEIPVERPAFAITSSSAFTVPFARPQKFSIESHPIQREQVQMDPTRTAFLIQYIDENGDGMTDDVNGDHLPDVYPKVIFRRTIPADNGATILVPLIIDPFPYLDALRARGFALTTHLDLLIPPVAVERSADGDTILPAIPPGEYETVVLSGTGQTWQIPNAIDIVQPPGIDPTQSIKVVMSEGTPLPSGQISGTIRAATETRGDAYVIVFSATNPPPPVGTGRPVALASIPRATFTETPSAISAQFTVRGLPDGNYLVRGLLDADNNFSPLSDLVAQPSSGDLGGGSTPAVVPVTGGQTTSGVLVELTTTVAFERPAFEFDPVTIPENGFPRSITLRLREDGAPPISDQQISVPVVLTGVDEDGDNFLDLLPRVLLTKMVDGDPRTAPDQSPAIVIPGIVDPLPFMTALAAGTPAVPATELNIILPPVALRLNPNGTRERISPPPVGRYRVNLLSATGQTWSVPSPLDVLLNRVGTVLEDQAQARFVEVADAAIPAGAITGSITLTAGLPDSDFSVIVLAFDVANPPPPAGSGRPVASAVIPKAAFTNGTASYALGGLATGTYLVRGFMDVNDNFTPWFDTMNQPDALDLVAVTPAHPAVSVDALAPPVANVGLAVTTTTIPADRPMFTLEGNTVLDLSTAGLSTTIRAVSSHNNILDQDGIFLVRWSDLDGNGVADDRNADGQYEVTPFVVAELLDPNDPTNTRVATPHVRIPGVVPAAQFEALGFPVNDILQTRATVATNAIQVLFPPIGLDDNNQRIPGVPGRYRISVASFTGQTWTIPNELQRAAGTDLPATQSTFLTVEE